MLKKDDWLLTLEQAKNQRNQTLIALEVSNAIIEMCKIKLKGFPDAKPTKRDKPIY